jgi:hypothetical protein
MLKILIFVLLIILLPLPLVSDELVLLFAWRPMISRFLLLVVRAEDLFVLYSKVTPFCATLDLVIV